MLTATESKELRFHFLHKRDLAAAGYDKVRKDTGEHEGQKLPEPEQEEAEVADLMAALRESVEQTKRRKKPAAKKPARRAARA